MTFATFCIWPIARKRKESKRSSSKGESFLILLKASWVHPPQGLSADFYKNPSPSCLQEAAEEAEWSKGAKKAKGDDKAAKAEAARAAKAARDAALAWVHLT